MPVVQDVSISDTNKMALTSLERRPVSFVAMKPLSFLSGSWPTNETDLLTVSTNRYSLPHEHQAMAWSIGCCVFAISLVITFTAAESTMQAKRDIPGKWCGEVREAASKSCAVFGRDSQSCVDMWAQIKRSSCSQVGEDAISAAPKSDSAMAHQSQKLDGTQIMEHLSSQQPSPSRAAFQAGFQAALMMRFGQANENRAKHSDLANSSSSDDENRPKHSFFKDKNGKEKKAKVGHTC